MKKVLGVLGVIGACVLCCSIPIAIPMLGAAFVSGAGLALGWDAALCAAVLVGGAGFLIWRARRARAAEISCSPSGCGTDAKKGC